MTSCSSAAGNALTVVPPDCWWLPIASSISASMSLSEWAGSWWKNASSFTPACSARDSASSYVECPKPAWVLYYSVLYWASWTRRLESRHQFAMSFKVPFSTFANIAISLSVANENRVEPSSMR